VSATDLRRAGPGTSHPHPYYSAAPRRGRYQVSQRRGLVASTTAKPRSPRKSRPPGMRAARFVWRLAGNLGEERVLSPRYGSTFSIRDAGDGRKPRSISIMRASYSPARSKRRLSVNGSAPFARRRQRSACSFKYSRVMRATVGPKKIKFRSRPNSVAPMPSEAANVKDLLKSAEGQVRPNGGLRKPCRRGTINAQIDLEISVRRLPSSCLGLGGTRAAISFEMELGARRHGIRVRPGRPGARRRPICIQFRRIPAGRFQPAAFRGALHVPEAEP
jgi:hypothetical protein